MSRRVEDERMADAIAFVRSAMEDASLGEALETLESTLRNIMYSVQSVAEKLRTEPASPKRIEKLRNQLFEIRDALLECSRGTLELRNEFAEARENRT